MYTKIVCTQKLFRWCCSKVQMKLLLPFLTSKGKQESTVLVKTSVLNTLERSKQKR